jgi:hypothetical protein
MITCPECDSQIHPIQTSVAFSCDQCLSQLTWNGHTVTALPAKPFVSRRKEPAKLNTLAKLDIPWLPAVDIAPVAVHNPDKVICIGCTADTDKLTSQAVKISSRFHRQTIETDDIDGDGLPLMAIRNIPIYQDGRICAACFAKVERRPDKQSHYRWYLGHRLVIFTFENVPGQTTIPAIERYRTPAPSQPQVLDKGRHIPALGITLHVDLTPDFPEPETDTHEESYKKFGFSRGSRDYRKYLR